MTASTNAIADRIEPIDIADMTAQEFERFANLARAESGVVLSTAKRQMVKSRLMRRLRACGVRSFSEYAEMLENGDKAEIQQFLNSITTHHTGFFREPHHFDTFEGALREWGQRNLQTAPIKIWSAAASSGQEPYSIGMSILKTAPEAKRQHYKVLATDIDTSVIANAAAGEYDAMDLERSARDEWRPHFHQVDGGRYRALPNLRALIAFKQLNLLHEWPMRGPFDAVFCRNVIIYFDNPTKAALLKRIRDVLKPGGLLFLGHSETLADREGLTPIGRTTFQKNA